ncbi:FtsB family cell division protein [Megalodesulfovibrio gigas]|uniref:Putative septum formation initiator family n=1 Tax=Megalodesulfovibrio gigas (strain ATCC 19364 / DSM 1382 / NCIMB 9332 / VKM B-1759) TaxID=1121448 RepID=T2GD79_MEGG1|nr:septum formation initiator family protein [Megalodesulfovibrio gigas]AGW14263.1 putative septum formation initiator family [Megalodesulfovibrio gigas DSM 1382 = ATCC 19364]
MPWNKLLAYGLVAINLVLGYSLFAGDQGLFSYLELRGRQDELTRRMQAVDEAGLALSNEIRLLKEDRVYIEKVIRQQLNYIRPNEVLYLFPGGDETDTGAMRHASKD